MGVCYAEMMKSNNVEKLSTYVNILTHYVLVEDRARMRRLCLILFVTGILGEADGHVMVVS